MQTSLIPFSIPRYFPWLPAFIFLSPLFVIPHPSTSFELSKIAIVYIYGLHPFSMSCPINHSSQTSPDNAIHFRALPKRRPVCTLNPWYEVYCRAGCGRRPDSLHRRRNSMFGRLRTNQWELVLPAGDWHYIQRSLWEWAIQQSQFNGCHYREMRLKSS